MYDTSLISDIITYSKNTRNNYNLFDSVFFLGFGLLNASGRCMYYNKQLPDNEWGWILFILESIIFAFISYMTMPYIQLLIETVMKGMPTRLGHSFLVKHFWMFSIIIIVLCWLPWVIAFCPASMEWDSYQPIMEYIGEWEKSNHHPWFYTCIVGTFYEWGRSIGSKEFGIFIYILIRNASCILIYSYICTKLFYLVSHLAGLAALAFYSIVPVWGAYAKHAFKDTLEAALFTWFMCKLVFLVLSLNHYKVSYRGVLEYSISGLLVSLFRNNGIYVVLPISFLAFFIVLKSDWKKAICVLSCLVVFFTYQFYIFDVIKINHTGKEEALGLVQQQVARTVRDHRDELSKAEITAIKGIQNIDKIGETYDMLLSDPVKGNFSDEAASKRYIRNWIKMFFHFPKTYIEAFVGQGYGYYSFTPREYVGAGNGNSGMTLFHWIKDDRFRDDITCDYVFPIESFRQFLAEWANAWDRLPIINITDSMPMYTWLIVYAGIVCLKKKQYIFCLPVAAELLYIVTCVLSPVNGAFRYYCPVAASIPAILFLFSDGRRYAMSNDIQYSR